MRDINDLLVCYEKGIYTFGEVITALICEAQTRAPSELAPYVPEQYREGITQAVFDLPITATADDVVIIKSSRAHAEAWFEGAVRWRAFLEEENARFRKALEHYDKMYSHQFVTARGPAGSTFKDSREVHTFDIGQVARAALGGENGKN